MNGRTFLLRWGLTSLGVLAATQIVPGIECPSWQGLLVAALILGLLNAFLRPVLLLLSLPLVLISLGLFVWVINAFLLSLVSWIVKPFHVGSFWSALGGAAVISLISGIGGAMLGLNQRPAPTGSRNARGPGPGPRPREGPTIDV